ncbi:MAG: hypothetical protein AAGF12_20845 [Myxococcota bacterium]
MSRMRLPGWVVDEVTSIQQEVERYRGMSTAELWRETQDCAKDAMWAIYASGLPERVLADVDPLPLSSQVALKRLRTQHDE